MAGFVDGGVFVGLEVLLQTMGGFDGGCGLGGGLGDGDDGSHKGRRLRGGFRFRFRRGHDRRGFGGDDRLHLREHLLDDGFVFEFCRYGFDDGFVVLDGRPHGLGPAVFGQGLTGEHDRLGERGSPDRAGSGCGSRRGLLDLLGFFVGEIVGGRGLIGAGVLRFGQVAGAAFATSPAASPAAASAVTVAIATTPILGSGGNRLGPRSFSVALGGGHRFRGFLTGHGQGGHGGDRAALPVAVAVPVTIPAEAAGAIPFGAGLIATHLVEVVVVFLKEVRDVEERIAFESHVHEGRLHAGQNPRHASLVNATRQRVLIGPLEVQLH